MLLSDVGEKKATLPDRAELIGENETDFRVWAPKAREVDVVVEERYEIKTNISSANCRATWIFFRCHQCWARRSLSVSSKRRRKFLSRPGIAFSTGRAAWSIMHCRCKTVPVDRLRGWARVPELKGQIIYEMHIGTFTNDGTWRAAAEQLSGTGAHRNHSRRNDASRRFPREISAGVTTESIFSRPRTYTERRTICAHSSIERTR